MNHIVLSSQSRSASNPFGDTQQLCEEWGEAWENLSACPDLNHTSEDIKTTSQSQKSFCRRIYALVDLPSTFNRTSVSEAAEERLIALLNCVPPPHVLLARDEFRLMRFEPTGRNGAINVSLVNKSLDEAGDDFTAISYCWGSPTQPRKYIFVNGRPVVIFDALHTLLCHFQTFASGYYWIDAICIRQDDVLEKNTQIPLMTRIYSAPRKVDIWLGPDQDNSAHVLELAHRPSVDARVSVKFLRGLTRLLNRQWFSRVWVLQEVVLAKPNAPVIRSGFAACSWNELMVIIQCFEDGGSDLCTLIAARERKLRRRIKIPVLEPLIDECEGEGLVEMKARLAVMKRNFAIVQARAPKHAKLLEWTNVNRDIHRALRNAPVRHAESLRSQYCCEGAFSLNFLQELVWRTKHHSATNPRDKIYGILGLLSVSALNVDYEKSVYQVYCEATRLTVLESGPTEFVDLMYSRPVVGISSKSVPQPASWALDFSHTHRDWAEHLIDRQYHATFMDEKDTSIDSSEPSIECELGSPELKVSASVVDVIAQVLVCSDLLIADALSDTDAQELQLLRYLPKLQDFHEAQTRSAAAWNPEVHDGLLGIIKQLPDHPLVTFAKEKCAEQYAALITACEKASASVNASSQPASCEAASSNSAEFEAFASASAVSASAASEAAVYEAAVSEAASSESASSVALDKAASGSDDSEADKEAETTQGAAEADSEYEYDYYSQPLSTLLYKFLITESVHRMSFFVTEQGLCGLCMPGAQIGDAVSILFHGIFDYPNVPFIIRPRDDGRYSMVTVAWVQAEWKDLARFRGTLDPQILTFR
jgi:hypothetical protein